jgi:uncharacterized protein YukE
LSAPICYTVPKVKGDPDAAYRLATAYRDLAGSLSVEHGRATSVIGELARGWRGTGEGGIDAPVQAFRRDATRLAHLLSSTAGELDTYGKQLETAHHHHGFSLHKLVAIGAIVVVSATAIVITLGAAGVLEAAAAAAAVGTATEAAGAAAAADVAAATGVDSALEGMSALRPLLTFVVPHLVQVEWAAGGTALWDELSVGKLNWREISENGALAFVASGAATKATALAGDSHWLTPHLIEGTAWSGAAAGDDELTNHRISLLDVSESFVLAGGGTMARDGLRERGMWPAEPDYRHEALVNLIHQRGVIADPAIARELAGLRQTAAELTRGDVDLRIHEGPGHTIDRHIGKKASELLVRVRTSHIRFASTYWDNASANDTIRNALSTHDRELARWIAAGSAQMLRLRVTMPYDLGYAVNAAGRLTFVRQAIVVLRRDSAGIVLVTSYPLGRR